MIKKDQAEKKQRKVSRFKTIFSISMLVVGVVALVGFLALMQNFSAERNQEKSSKLILSEVETTLRKNDEIYNSVFHEFNEINQSTLGALSQYATYIDILGPISHAAATNDPNLNDIVNDTVSDLKDICNNLNLREVFIVKDDGEIQISSNFQYLNENLNDMFSNEQMSQLIGYETSATGEVIRSGTVRYVDGDEEFSPILVEYDGSQTSFYLYSTYFGTNGTSDYYLLTYAPSSLIEEELRGIKDISSVLSGITVGKSGFLFAVDAKEGVFTYFDDGKTSLTGQSYSSKGLKQEAAKDDYIGYQTINGVKYFCVTKQFDFDAYGKYTVVAAVVSQDEIISNNILTICFSSLAFVLVAAIVSGYGLILRRDIADHILGLEDKFKSNLKDETVTKKIAFTDEEIEERTKILLDETIAKNKDRKLKRKNLGVRNAKGQQRYFSTYIFGKLASVIAVGLVAIFGISFFSQTLLGLNDATSVSTNRLNEIIETITKNDENSERIQGYVDDQFLSKARLVSYLLEETPEIVFENNPESCEHRVFEKDDNGNNVYLDYDAYPGNPRIAWSNSPALIEFCKNIGVDSIYLYSDDGKCLATSTDYWYFSISKDPNDQSYPFNDILDDKKNYYIQDVMIGEITGKYDKFIGSEYYYYTYDNAGEVAFAKRTDYEDYKDGTWVGSP
ncbi:MAG: hypothetical protein MJ238_07425, partial [Bacilli bacterium]|nr:hypothetical protein [Bacilli bacterium]